jgi:hypothetical protein
MTRGALLLAAAASGLLLAAPAAALTTKEQEFTCPLDGERFKGTVPMSFTQRGRFLDGKPYGALLVPWPLPKCPTTGFVMYKRDLDPGEIARLREYVKTPAYAEAAPKETTYWLAAMILRHMGAPAAHVAYTLLQATWEAEETNRYQRYARAALEAQQAVLADPKADARAILTAQLVSGELERRLGLFDEARARFQPLLARDEVKGGYLEEIVRLELSLVEKRDTATHRMPEPKAPPPGANPQQQAPRPPPAPR